MGDTLSKLFSPGVALDEDLLEELETTLLMADVGVTATLDITAALRLGIKSGVISEPSQLLPAVQAELYELIESCEQLLQIDPEKQAVPPVQEPPALGVEQTVAGTRLIKIPTEKLIFSGDPRYNIVIKSGDSIFVPVDIIGEFCIMGNVNRTGYIPLTGRPMTLKQAIAAAGGLGPLAWPKRCEVVRRIGRKKEEIVMVDLDKIASGEQPDFFIKPHDLINVGTHATARWRAV